MDFGTRGDAASGNYDAKLVRSGSRIQLFLPSDPSINNVQKGR